MKENGKKEDKEEKKKEWKGPDVNDLWDGADANDVFEGSPPEPKPLAKEWKSPKIIFETQKNLPDIEKEILKDNLPHIALGGAEKVVIKNIDMTSKQENPMNKLSHPMQAYSYRMGDIDPLEDMVWGILERIGFLPVYHANTVRELCFELGKIHQRYIAEIQAYVDKKGEKYMEKEDALKGYDFALTVSGKPMSGKTTVLNLVEAALMKKGYETVFASGNTFENEHRLLIKKGVKLPE